jgi:hypothetical protein
MNTAVRVPAIVVTKFQPSVDPQNIPKAAEAMPRKSGDQKLGPKLLVIPHLSFLFEIVSANLYSHGSPNVRSWPFANVWQGQHLVFSGG